MCVAGRASANGRRGAVGEKMAASEEESGQSDSKNDDSATHETSKQFSTIHQQEIENQLSRPGVSYENRVSAVLSGWEHLAGTVEGDVGQLQPLATFLYRWSLRLILQGEWPGLAQIVKTRLGVTLQRCSRVAVLQPLCRTLLPLVSDPWGHTTKTIFSDSEVQDEEAIKYISNETWEVVRVRVDTMVESRCEELAFRVLKVCIRCIRLRSEGKGVPLYTDEDHNHFVDLYFVLLYKFQRKAFLEEVKALDVHEGVNLVQRLVTKQDKAKVWKHRLKIADLAIQIFLATSIVKKYSHDFWAVFLEWCGVQEAAAVADDVLIQMIHKYMQLCEASQHIYSMGSILHKKFGNRLASLVTELLIRALTMDMNSLEALKLKQIEGSQKEEQVQLERQMADGFMDLATVFTHHKTSHPVPSSLVASSQPTTVPTSYTISSPTPHFPSATLRPEASNDGTEMELSTTCLQSTSTSDMQTGSFNTSEGTDITIDTGQPYPNMSSVADSEESQMTIENSAQIKMEDLSLSQTKDISTNDKELDSITHGVSRMKDDVDSMDKFYKSTENFIEQLSQEPPIKSKLTNLCPGHQNYDVLTQPNQVLDAEQLGITKELCDDLAVVLSSPRWQVLSWMLDWGELSKICGQYIKDADSAKNMTKELKYLNIDYSQFQNMPSAEITEFTGIEKGYEHFIEHESENEVSDDECSVRPKGGHISPTVELNTDSAKISKRGRGRPKKMSQISRPYDSDSDLDTAEQLKGSSCYMISMSESEESDIDNKNKTYLHMDSERSGVIEGKRVTAVSNQDRSKRIRIDAETGKLRKDRSLLNSLRLFRHQKYGGDLVYDSEFEGLQRSAENFAPPLSSLNLNPRVVLTERDKSAVDQQLQRSMTTAMAGKRVGSGKATLSSQSRESWRYAGSFVAPNPTSAARPATSVPLPRSPSVQCYVRHKDGKVRFASFNRSILAGSRPPNPGGQNNYLKLLKRPTSGYDDSYAKFLLQQNPSLKGKGPEDNATRKSMTLDASLDYLKKQGTTVTYRRKTGSALALANAQKTVLNRIMSPENALSAISSRTAIAMPVSNNPPNLPPSDKTNPANLSRVLPKGTTVVRKPKSDGAGPSGLSNNSGSGSSSGTRTVVSRPGSFPTVVARPNTTVSSVVRSGSSVMAVRTNASTIRTTYSRGVVVTGSLGTQEVATNRSTSPPLTDSSPSTPGGVPSGSGSSSSSTPAPLVSATVVGSVLTTVPSSSPMGTQSGNTGKQQQQQQQLLQQSWDVVQNEGVCVSGVESNTTITQMSSTTRGATTCTTTVASPPGDTRAASMLETLLRDRPVPPSPLHTQSTTAITTITAALPSTITSIVGSSSVPMAVTGESQVTNAVVGALSSTGNNSGNVVIASGSNANSGVIMASGVVGAPTGGGVVVASSGIVGSSGVGVNSSVGEGGSGAVQQVLLPGQIVQVHTSDGTTGIGIVQSSSLDLRLPAGTRVIKPGGGTIRTTAAQQQQVTGVINQTGGRQVNVLHNVKILQNVQNRQIVRTVVVPHPVALQGLNTPSGQLKPQVVSLSQGTSTSVSTAGEGGVIQPQVPATTVRAKIPPTTIVQKVLSRSGLVIRTVRPQTSSTQASGDAASFEEGLGAKLQQQQQAADGEKNTGTTATTNVTVARLPSR
ncbi:hypothetical protein O3P69_008937 [Scylla paramamosain]|uniref:Uncharacterized protein n=1 Tax=Scylla paramamosain TaxID=85552 RepID=A0AAW0TQE2_SCYPA